MQLPKIQVLLTFIIAVLAPLVVLGGASQGTVAGNSTIHAMAGPAEIIIRTSDRTAGAICSLRWNGKEFIDETDHGRELQSACNLDVAGDIQAETFNPTEAGARDDWGGPRTTSRLLFLHASGSDLATTNQMAFWLLPGEKSGANLAKNTTALSNHLLSKRVDIGVPNFPHAIEYTVTFALPRDKKHVHGVFEALTAYMPIEFDSFWSFDLASRKLQSVDAGPSEDSLPLIFSTKDGNYAMGIYSPPDAKIPARTYGRFKFDWAKVTKWNCVFRLDNPKGIPPGDYTCRMYVIVGTLADVRSTMDSLSQGTPQKP